MRAVLPVLIAIGLTMSACQGDPGPAGSSCTVTDHGDGTVTITCDDGTEVTISDGAPGGSCTVLDHGDGTRTIECEDGTRVVVSDGEDGSPGDGYLPLAPQGVVGVVRDRAGVRLAGGTIYFVPADDVAALPATTIHPDSPDDEPLEDLIAANAATYPQAAVGADGIYRLETLAAGAYFVTFVPAAADAAHLPGGSACRAARSQAELIGTRLDLEVSGRPPASARFIGSGRCLTCHGTTHLAGTMHRLGIWSPYESGLLQDPSGRYDELWQALRHKFTAEGTMLWFHNYPQGTGFDVYDVAETDPGGDNVSFTVTLRKRSPGGQDVYEMMLQNVKNPADPDRVYRLDAVYGGGVWKQRYLTRVVDGAQFFYMTLPLQYNLTGDDGNPSRSSRTWRDYYGKQFYSEAGPASVFRPIDVANAAGRSFEKQCISCHAAGVQVTADGAGWRASLITDPIWGDFDYDGDGLKDELNIGCETCHGPGSAHWEAAGQGKAIVSPSLLTPEREAMICGQCHSRPKGALGTDSPVNADGWMMWAGTSRAEFLARYATTQLDAAPNDLHGDPDGHSKSHHQQYTDFIRSAMYKNDRVLMVCSDCHDPHRADNARQLRVPPADEDGLCGGACHPTQTADKQAHMRDAAGFGGGAMAVATCVQCHMPKTAKTGAGEPGLTSGGVQYWTNDISSHLFRSPSKEVSRRSPGFDVPTGYTDRCGQVCHQL
jgi:predicted CXXCH cytochrome family protein